MELNEILQWRYATKKMNGEKVSEEKLKSILNAARFAPTSSGLQPFKIIVVSSPELKKQIQPIASGQSQIVDSSHLLIFCAWDKYTDERIDHIFNLMNQERGLPSSATEAYVGMLKEAFAKNTEEQQQAHAAKQAYISLGFALMTAAIEKVDATPMEGFDNAALDQLLELPQKGLRSAAILALGYRDTENDWLVNLKKVRHPEDEFFIYL